MVHLSLRIYVRLRDYLRRGGRNQITEILKKELLRDCSAAAWTAASASTMRAGNIRLDNRGQWEAALELAREGHGIIRKGSFEVWINAIPPLLRGSHKVRL
jgi:hypothetical protein